MILKLKLTLLSLIPLITAQFTREQFSDRSFSDDSFEDGELAEAQGVHHTSKSIEVQRMQEMLDGLLDIKERQMIGPNEPSNRNIVSFLFDVSSLDGYGCWCRLEENTHGGGRGFPVDKYDRACRSLHYATSCLMMDHGTTCSPWTTSYAFNVGLDSVDCVLPNNGDQCRIDLCTLEAEFVLGVLKEITSFTAENLNHSRFNPNSPTFTNDFSYDDCLAPPQTPSGGGGSGTGGTGNAGTGTNIPRPTSPTTSKIEVDHFDQECCGRYPGRYPFKSHLYDINDNVLAERACCDFDNGDVGLFIYDVDSRQCCDGAVQDFGNLC